MIGKRTMAIQNGLFTYGRHRIPLFSGEFHYWRNTAEHWGAIFRALRAMGLRVVSTYVPWNYHEIEPGRYDFDGTTSPQRNLVGFLEQAAREGFHVFIRPGPYIYAEWPHGGVPERAARYHRLDPAFLQMARHYTEHVCRVLAPWQITRGGPIILCQACNEPYPPIETFAEAMGCFGPPGLFQSFLREKYQNDLDRLNQRWRASLSSFDEAFVYFHEIVVNTRLPLAQRLLPPEPYAFRYADTLDFIGWYGAEVVRQVSEWMRASGIEVPIVANGWSALYQDFRRLNEVADLVGCDLYPMPFIEGDRQSEDEWLSVMDIVKSAQVSVTNNNLWAAEFQSGIYPLESVGYLPPDHFRFVALALTARGMRGWNWYMAVTRDNWAHAPVNEWGRPNEYFAVHREVVETMGRLRPWELEEHPDVAVLLYKPHRICDPAHAPEILRSLEDADIAWHYYDPTGDRPPPAPILIYAGAEWIEREAADRLVRFVREGGTLIGFSRFPCRDDAGHSLTDLPLLPPEGARPVLLPVTVRYGRGAVRLVKGGHLGRKVNFFYYRDVPGEPLWLDLNPQAREVLVDVGGRGDTSFRIGYACRVGKGKVILVGSNPCPELMRLIVEQEGGVTVSAGEPGVLTHWHQAASGGGVLFVINRNASPRRVLVTLGLTRAGLWPTARYRVLDEAGGTRILFGRRLAAQDIALSGHAVAWRKIEPIRPSGKRKE